MQQAEETAAEAEAQRNGTFGLEEERRIVEPQLLQCLAQQRVLVCIDGVDPGEDHRLQLFEAGQRLDRRMMVVGNGVADFAISNCLDSRGQETDLAGRKTLYFDRFRRQHTEGLDVEGTPIRHQSNALPFAEYALNHARQHHDASIRIEPRVEDERLQLIGSAPYGRRDQLDDRLQHLGHALPGLGTDGERMRGVQPHRALDHFFCPLDVGARQVNFVDDGNDFEPVVDGDVGVGQCLRFHALRCVDHQQRALARGQRPRDFIAEVHMPGRVDQVELIRLAIGRGIHHADRMRLDGDAALALQVHRVQHLRLHLARCQRAGKLQQTVGKRALPMIDMGDDREISDE